MLILLPVLILISTTIILLLLRVIRPGFQFSWLIASGGSLLGLIAVLLWHGQLPVSISMTSWQPASLFADSPMFAGDRLSLPYALSLTVLGLTLLLTAGVREEYPNSLTWVGTLTLTALGLLAITSANPLTLVLVWTALDLTELVTQLWSAKGPNASERVVISFSTRVLGSGLLVWANIISISAGNHLDFQSISPQSGLFLVAAAGLRLGVLPLHLSYSAKTTLPRSFSTALRQVSAASSLVLLTHVPSDSITSPFTWILLFMAAIAAIYCGWMWLRAPDELSGQPFWMIGLAALAVSAALLANPLGVAGWSCALILVGGALLLVSVQHIWLNRALLLGIWGLSALPFSLTASAWQKNAHFQITIPLFITAQALLMAGFVHHAVRPRLHDTLEAQPIWTRNLYPVGIGLLLLTQLLLGVWGWNGAFQIGNWPVALAASILTLGLLWATPRFHPLNPLSAHWERPVSPWFDGFYHNLWSLYRILERFTQAVSGVLEGDGGLMWTLLFLVIFVSLMTQRTP
jgi:hypothetical protein